MKKINTNEASPAIIKEVKTIENCPFIKEVNKRYGFRIGQEILLCDESKLKQLGWKFSDRLNLHYVFKKHALASKICTVELSDLKFNSLDGFFKVTKTEYYSSRHKYNKLRESLELFTGLIPVITIHYKGRSLLFQLNNQFIKDFFEDTEILMRDNLTNEEKEIINRRFLEHKEFLKHFFAPDNSDFAACGWINIYYNKLIGNNNNMLHSEFEDKYYTTPKGNIGVTFPMTLDIHPIYQLRCKHKFDSQMIKKQS